VKDADGPLIETMMALYGSGLSHGNSHGTTSLPLVLAGGTQLGLEHGPHVDYNRQAKDFVGYGKGTEPRPTAENLGRTVDAVARLIKEGGGGRRSTMSWPRGCRISSGAPCPTKPSPPPPARARSARPRGSPPRSTG
jgi:hypothetical protein